MSVGSTQCLCRDEKYSKRESLENQASVVKYGITMMKSAVHFNFAGTLPSIQIVG